MLTETLRNLFPLHGSACAFAVILSQFLSSFIVNTLSYETLYRLYPLFKAARWERGGQIYQDIFHIRDWKDYIPAIGNFDKKHMEAKINSNYLSLFLLESLRAELCHAASFLLGLIICLLSDGNFVDFKILLWLLVINTPCVMIQRYNRPRFERLLCNLSQEGLARFWERKTETIREKG